MAKVTSKLKTEISEERNQRRLLAESDLEEFIKLIHPKRLLGNIHREVIRWMNRENAGHYQLILLPRDHGKSALLAYRIAWALTKDPTLRILLISSTSNLATKQLKFIKDILTSDVYRIYWPEMVNKEDVKREKWTEKEISVDHPLRKEWAIREPSIFTAGLTTNIVGLHADIIAMDDVVVADNAYTEETRQKVSDQYGYLSSVAGASSYLWAVGTRYHPKDLYAEMMSREVEMVDENGKVHSAVSLFETFERSVESVGDGTGEFLWPRAAGVDGRKFGFDAQILAEKRAQYKNRLHFRAQYYNDPHDVDSSPIQRNLFQYYDANFLSKRDGRWYFKGERLNVVASIDFAYSLGKRADATSVVVVGGDSNKNFYVLDIDRFKTDLISEYFDHILKMHQKWGFRQIRAEVSVAQAAIVKDLKESYIRPLGLGLSIDEFRPSRWQGSKEERIMATLQPKYANGQIYHYQSGNCQLLEEELLMANPAHDDVKDALSSAIDFCDAPVNNYRRASSLTVNPSNLTFHSRFGGTT